MFSVLHHLKMIQKLSEVTKNGFTFQSF